MRPLIIQVPEGNSKKVFDIAQKYQGKNLALFNGSDSNMYLDIILAFISNG